VNEPFPASDPQQLPLRTHEGEQLVPVEFAAVGEEMVAVPLREPPVCGEWSYDDSDLEETRLVARRIDRVPPPAATATPLPPSKAFVDSKATSARQDGTPTSEPIIAPRPDGARGPRPTLEALRLAFEQSRSDTTRILAYAAALERSGDAPGALTVLDEARSVGAEPFAIECARANALGAMLKYDDAAKAIKAAAKLRPDDPELDVQTGILNCRRARWKDAIEPLRKGVAGAPDHAQAHYYIGEALNKSDRLEEARAAYERAAQLDPENWRALKGVGVALDRLGRSADAASWYRRAREAQRV
jgi:tetratricopeptide (TPR) repeat protein